jgi:phage regulator Rha-like protein
MRYVANSNDLTREQLVIIINKSTEVLEAVQDKHDTLLALIKEFKVIYENLEGLGDDEYHVTLFKFYLKVKGL